jgi:hypothetical protein
MVVDSSGVRITVSSDADNFYAQVDTPAALSLGGGDADNPKQFYNIQGLYIDAADNIWVANRGSNELRIFDRTDRTGRRSGETVMGPASSALSGCLGAFAVTAWRYGTTAILASQFLRAIAGERLASVWLDELDGEHVRLHRFTIGR